MATVVQDEEGWEQGAGGVDKVLAARYGHLKYRSKQEGLGTGRGEILMAQ